MTICMYPHLCANMTANMMTKRRSPSIDAKKYYTAEQAALLLQQGEIKVTPGTVKNYCRQGKLKCKQIGPKKFGTLSAPR